MGLQPADENPRYWAYRGEPVLLLGGSKEDNLFQSPDLEQHLDQLQSVGGNYVRNTMSSRDDGNVWPFKKTEAGYDLEQWNDEYWNRFERFLAHTAERKIVVQIEVWATFDFYQDRWDRNPFNPKININYSKEESGLPTVVKSHPLGLENNFFWSIPNERNQENVLKFQRRFVDKMLSYSLNHDHVLYCMDNETAVTPEWGRYWSTFVRSRATEQNKKVHTTEMWDPWNLDDAKHKNTFDHPETYSFVDISQNNHQKGQRHWDNAQKQRARIVAAPRPLNNVKIYGADGGAFGDDRDAMERFWRNIMGGLASSRFHRPHHGLGLNEKARANIRSLRMLTDEMTFYRCEPQNDLLSDRDDNEAYCFGNPGSEYAVYFPRGGSVALDASATKKKALTVRWLDIMTSTWSEPTRVESGVVPLDPKPSDDRAKVVLLQTLAD
jgi:hypothetical protein